MNGGLEPEELTRLLRAAVEPVRPSPDALRQIRAGVERRRWWRLPLMATGGVVMAGLIALAFVAVRPHPSSNQVVEPAAPPLVTSSIMEPNPPATSRPPGSGSGSGGSGGGSGGSTTRRPSTSPPPTTATTPPETSPSSPTASSTTGSGGAASADLPTAVTRPAGANDVDGDGSPDQVRLNGTKVEVAFSRGGSAAVDLPGLQLPAVRAVVDANGDGFAEILVRTASRDGIDDYVLLRYAARGVISQATPAAGLRLAAGVRDDGGFGFRCDENGLRVISGTSSDGADFQIVTTPVQITPDGLVAGQAVRTQATAASANAQFLAACGTFS